MDVVIALLIVIGGFGVLLTAFAWLARRVRLSGAGGHLMGPIDEVYHPTAHQWRQEIEIHEQRGQPPAGAGRLRRSSPPGR
jgi:hypothetical protein